MTARPAPVKVTGTVPASQTLTLTFRPRASYPITVSQVSIEMAATAAGAGCFLRLDGTAITPLVPTGDAAGGDPPIDMDPNQEMTVVWTGAPVGAIGTMLVFYDIRRTH